MKNSLRLLSISLCVPLLSLAACSDDDEGTGIRGGSAPRIEVTETNRAVPEKGTVTVSPDGVDIKILNRGSGDLNVKSIVLESDPPGAFILSQTNNLPANVGPDGASLSFRIEFNPESGPATRDTKGTVSITTNRTINLDSTTFEFYLTPTAASPKIRVEPSYVDFGVVGENDTVFKEITVLNLGSVPLEISKFYLKGHPDFSVTFQGTDYGVSPQSTTGIAFDEIIVVEPGGHFQFRSSYFSQSEGSAEGQLVLMSNDSSQPNGTEVRLLANLGDPCIRVNPPRVDFGGKIVGDTSVIDVEIENCGDLELEITALDITDDLNDVFGLDLNGVDLPLVLNSGQRATILATYTPETLAPYVDGAFVQDEATLDIQNNSYLSHFKVDVSGFGTDGSCPTPIITVEPGTEVIPQTNLRLSARDSIASQGQISAWRWSVVQPSGSPSQFQPSNRVESPTFEVNVMGTYTFKLEVTDSLGVDSCSSAEVKVFVTSDEAIHVELLWHTPNDPNELNDNRPDFTGADLDLHFLHPNANGEYYSRPYDCYWSNKNPEWGFAGSPDDNPRLDRDDTNGAGPENLNMRTPEANARYQVGVHYYDDAGFGDSYATVRVFLYGALRDEWEGVRMTCDQMWDTHYIQWGSGPNDATITRITNSSGGPRMVNGYLGGNGGCGMSFPW